MDIRKVQRTGNMYYVYLPTAWCKKQGINADSQVGIEQDSSGVLSVNPQTVEKKAKDLRITISEDDPNVIQKVIMACYINPSKSFHISLEKEMDFAKLLHQKKLIQIEMIEMDKRAISCESNIMIEDPDALLKTMVHKTRNLLQLMASNYDKELIARYEDEIDKSKILIDKAIIASLTFNKITKLKTIDLYYISMISRQIERMVDHIINIDKSDVRFLGCLLKSVDILKSIVDEIAAPKGEIGIKSAITFIKSAGKIPNPEIRNLKTYDKGRIRGLMIEISEIFIDWAITKQIEKN